MMAGFATGLISGGMVGALALAGLSLAMPGVKPDWTAPKATVGASGPLLVVPDKPLPSKTVTPKPAAPMPPAATRPEAGAGVALAPVPAGSEFARDRKDSTPRAPAPSAAPQLADAPMDTPAAAPPRIEPRPDTGLDQPGARPDTALTAPEALPVPELGADAPARPGGEAPIPVPPPGEAVAPALNAPRSGLASDIAQNPVPQGLAPPPQILTRP